jgi:Concanavalin A-like lectin/glucanases superfamily
MSYAVIIVAVIVTLVTIYLVYTAITASPAATGTISIVGPISDGRKQFDSPTQIPTSFNQAQGMTFSYACWVKINDFSYRYGAPKVVFTKGPIDLSVMCPALFLDASSNSLIVKIDTFGGTETIPIGNIPAQKWVHIAIAVSQESVDIYVDGNLYIHHTLTQIPKQNSETVHTTIAGGFDGSIAGLTHYNYLLTPESIAPIMASAPVTAQDTTVVPPYHDQSFWLSHLTDGR